ncbi:SET domain-containing protein [Bimuria novae-zelandiae CBS 107.79]|uniref:SET domain-containing protein n=1 Tax=Bimuria novae-zelandiae CBS 107.79 TaxID=1447943 RepID=A0A6A5VP59_9PLEO|nr:SET domain-containing protein [Bimuria novae-zelandiae CBS 107.79]
MPPKVVIPSTGGGNATRRVRTDKIYSIISNRIKGNEEQYLVWWKSESKTPPLSWHSITELVRCLEIVQDYITVREKTIRDAATLGKKRKSPDTAHDHEPRASPFDHLRIDNRWTPSSSRSQSVSSRSTTPASGSNGMIDVYNGVIESDADGLVFARSASGSSVAMIDVQALPTEEMFRTARTSKIEQANVLIRAEYVRRLRKVKGKKIHLVNVYDYTTPSLRFQYIDDYILRDGVYRADPATQMGCQKCSPHMGRSIGCEYTKKCDCLEYAAVDESRLTTDQIEDYNYALASGGSTMGFPKKFPYYCEGTKRQRAGTLVPFYLDSRNPIYECNDNCRCGLFCRNKNVQFGRQVEVEIFKTPNNRGWGLRCKEALHMGQFIDTYRGEVITDEEATRREEAGGMMKASYLYQLDKHAETEGLTKEEMYVVDGEFMGGPTKFMNHSCQPNCRQYTVSYNKHDHKVYDLAFFAIRDIPADEELTFDYLDKEEEDAEEDAPKGAVPCLCGAAKCRKWLWQ